MNFRPRKKEEPEINLIPFIDVLLVVLIFLMLSTTYSKFTELQLKLPVADADAQRDYPKEVIVAVSSDGKYVDPGRAGAGPQRRRGGARAGRGRQGRQGQRRHHQRRCRGAAPVGDHRHGSGAPRRPDADHLRHAVLGPGRKALTMALGAGTAARLVAARSAGLRCCGRCRLSSARWPACAGAGLPHRPAAQRRASACRWSWSATWSRAAPARRRS